MPRTKKILPNYTYEEYCQWEGSWELIDGIPYAMTPAPTPRHQRIAVNAGVILHQQLKAKNCSCTIYQPIDVKINEHTVVQPDLLIVCAPIDKPYLDFPPTLVVEILSPSTRDKDLHTKKELYADFGIKYYLIIDPDNISIDVHLLNERVYDKLDAPYQLEINMGCQINPDFKDLFD